MKNFIHKHKIIFITGLVILSFASIFSFTYANISTTSINVGSAPASTTVNPEESAEYKTSTEEKEAPHFNIFTILNKFIPN